MLKNELRSRKKEFEDKSKGLSDLKASIESHGIISATPGGEDGFKVQDWHEEFYDEIWCALKSAEDKTDILDCLEQFASS